MAAHICSSRSLTHHSHSWPLRVHNNATYTCNGCMQTQTPLSHKHIRLQRLHANKEWTHSTTTDPERLKRDSRGSHKPINQSHLCCRFTQTRSDSTQVPQKLGKEGTRMQMCYLLKFDHAAATVVADSRKLTFSSDEIVGAAM